MRVPSAERKGSTAPALPGTVIAGRFARHPDHFTVTARRPTTATVTDVTGAAR